MLEVGELGSSYKSHIFLISGYLCFIVSFSSINPFIPPFWILVWSIFTYVHKHTYLHTHMHEDLNLGRSRDSLRAYKSLCIPLITNLRWKIMSTIVQLQYDKCESPNGSTGPEWCVFVFFKPMSLLIYYNSNEQPSSLFPTSIFKALQIAIWTIL